MVESKKVVLRLSQVQYDLLKGKSQVQYRSIPSIIKQYIDQGLGRDDLVSTMGKTNHLVGSEYTEVGNSYTKSNTSEQGSNSDIRIATDNEKLVSEYIDRLESCKDNIDMLSVEADIAYDGVLTVKDKETLDQVKRSRWSELGISV